MIFTANLFGSPGRRSKTAPLFFASPHSGRLYPADFVRRAASRPWRCAAPRTPSPTNCSKARWNGGRPLIAARFPARLSGRQPRGIRTRPLDVRRRLAGGGRRTERARRGGLGVIPRIVRDGAEIYRGQTFSRRRRGAAGAALQALSCGADGTDRRNPCAFRRGDPRGLPFHARGRRRFPTSCSATVTALPLRRP